jgi:hypothetical protein
MERAVVFSDDHVVGVRFQGRVVVSYPRRTWEPTRVEKGVRFWSSRERIPVELFEVTSKLNTVARKINDTNGFSKPPSSRVERPGHIRGRNLEAVA